MLVHLLFTALFSGIHSGNVTNSSGREELMWERSSVESNLTLVTKLNDSGQPQTTTMTPEGTVQPGRPAFPSEDLADLEAALGLPPDTKLNLTTEEDKSFQDQEQWHPLRHCHQKLLEQHIHSCGLEFKQSMEDIGEQHWCSFDQVIRPYNSLSICLESLCSVLDCYYPNPTVQDYFLDTHATFFLRCPEEKVALPDAPHALVVVLTLGPVTLIPLLVYLVVRKSNGRD